MKRTNGYVESKHRLCSINEENIGNNYKIFIIKIK